MSRSSITPEPIYPDRPASLRAWVDVDLGAVRRNADRLRARAGVPIVAMVKADAYGLGMVPIARALGADFGEAADAARAPNAPWALGIATLHEAAELRRHGCVARVLCTTPLTVHDVPEAQALQVRPALHDSATIGAWLAMQGGPWHLAIDTGMARAGVRWDGIAALRETLHDARHVNPPEGVFTHFHSAEVDDGSLAVQDARFEQAVAAIRDLLPEGVLVHSDNSAAIAVGGASNARRRHLARPGIGLYGANVLPSLPLEQVVRVCARVIDVRDMQSGESVSYNATWQADSPRRIATVALGYADGYRRALSNRGVALVHGVRVPVVGNVTMDMTMLDVTGLGAACVVGDVATFVGRDGLDVLRTDAVAATGAISMYELLVGLRLRAPRFYVDTPSVGTAGDATGATNDPPSSEVRP